MLWLRLLFLLSIPYLCAIYRPGRGGIYCVETLPGSPPSPEKAIRSDQLADGQTVLVSRVARAYGWALLFSLMTACSMGFKELNPGKSLGMVMPSELQFSARGWTRTIAGLHSLASVYLLGLWLLCYFGRPFAQ